MADNQRGDRSDCVDGCRLILEIQLDLLARGNDLLDFLDRLPAGNFLVFDLVD